MSNVHLGIDISKEHFDVALLRDEQYITGRFDNNSTGFGKLYRWLKKHKAHQCPACMEATGRYGEALAESLYENQYSVSVVNPVMIKRYAESRMRRNKTDREDAKLIAHYCATQAPDLWQPPPPHIRELQEMTRRLAALKDSRTAELNRRQSGVRSVVVLDDLNQTILFLEQQIATLAKAIDDHIDQHPDLKKNYELIKSIPSLGHVTASSFIAEVPDISRFESASQLAAYAGLSPSFNHSGKQSFSNGKMSKIGNARLRTLFYMPQKSARRWNPIIASLVERLQEKGKSAKVIRGAIMRKLLHLAYGVLKTQKPFDPHYLVNLQDPS